MRRGPDFHTEYGMCSGPGVEVFEDLERALDISSEVRGVESSWRMRRRSGGGGGLGVKKWYWSMSATAPGSEATGRSGNLCGGQPNANLLAV